MIRPALSVLVPVMLVGVVATASAQAIDPPQTADGGLFGRRRPADPSRTTQELSLTLNVGSGLDNNSNSEGLLTPTPGFVPELTGFVSSGGALLRHRVGRPSTYLESSLRGYLSRGTVGIEQMSGGSGLIQGQTTLGRRSGVSASIGGSYDPSYLFNAFGPVMDQVDAFDPVEGQVTGSPVPGAAPSQGITEQRWLAAEASASAYRDWTPDQRTEVRYGASQRKPANGIGLDSRLQSVAADHTWSVGRRVGFGAGYRYTDRDQSGAFGAEQPLVTQALEGTMRFEHHLSATRSMAFAIGGGATKSRTLAYDTRAPYEFLLPTFSGSARLDLSRWWSLSADGRRDVTVLEGLTPEPFATDAVALRLNGTLYRRVQIALSGGYSRGLSQLTTAAEFESTVATVQTQYAIAHCCAAFVGYSYYDHKLQDVATIQLGFPPLYERNSVRVGMTFWLPLYGRF